MSEIQQRSVIRADADNSRIWYPLHPRWIPLLRVFGALSLLIAIYRMILHWPWSLSSLLRWCVPAILIFSCLFIQPELQVPAVLNRVGGIAHLLLVILVLPLTFLALILYWLRA